MTGAWHSSQAAALEHVERRARQRSAVARATLEEVCAMSAIEASELERAVASIRTHARVALHFHPDRLVDRERSVAHSLLDSGLYKSQFETLLSNGSLTAYPGGWRDAWERELFGGAYHAAGVSPAHRPKYGALDLLRHPDGAAPRFGSCYFVLAPALCARSSFSYLDSHQQPMHRGTLQELDDVLAALLGECFTRDFALGERNVRPGSLIELIRTRLPSPYADPASRPACRNLDHYIEAQVHGDVRLAQDVEALVADPSFRSTPTGDTLQQLCERYAIRLLWHGGFTLAAAAVPGDFRGPAMPPLAARIARNGHIDAATIGDAARDVAGDWSDAAGVSTLQQLKLLWHVLVRFGRPHAER